LAAGGWAAAAGGGAAVSGGAGFSLTGGRSASRGRGGSAGVGGSTDTTTSCFSSASACASGGVRQKSSEHKSDQLYELHACLLSCTRQVSCISERANVCCHPNYMIYDPKLDPTSLTKEEYCLLGASSSSAKRCSVKGAPRVHPCSRPPSRVRVSAAASGPMPAGDGPTCGRLKRQPLQPCPNVSNGASWSDVTGVQTAVCATLLRSLSGKQRGSGGRQHLYMCFGLKLLQDLVHDLAHQRAHQWPGVPAGAAFTLHVFTCLAAPMLMPTRSSCHVGSVAWRTCVPENAGCCNFSHYAAQSRCQLPLSRRGTASHLADSLSAVACAVDPMQMITWQWPA
jgi:hypothetical protein